MFLLVDRRLLLLAIPIVIAAFFLLPTSILNRITSIGNMADSSIKHRFDILNVTFNVIRDNWVAGVGFGYLPFKMVFETYNRYINMYHVHNTYLQTIGELGIPAFTVFAIMLFTFIKYPILKLVKRKDDTYYRYVGAGIVAGLVGILSQGFFESILYLPRIIFIFWSVVGIMIAMVNVAGKDNNIELNSIDQSVVVKRGNRK